MSQSNRAVLSAGRVVRAGDVVKGRVLGPSRFGTMVELATERGRSKLVIEPDPISSYGTSAGRSGDMCLAGDQSRA